MTAHVEKPLDPVGPGPDYVTQSIWLPQLYLEAARQNIYTIENRTFTECLLEGPAVLLPVHGVHFDDCFFGSHGGNPKALLLNPMSDYQVLGVIPFRNCKFERCTFAGVGFTGQPKFVQELLSVLRGETQ